MSNKRSRQEDKTIGDVEEQNAKRKPGIPTETHEEKNTEQHFDPTKEDIMTFITKYRRKPKFRQPLNTTPEEVRERLIRDCNTMGVPLPSYVTFFGQGGGGNTGPM